MAMSWSPSTAWPPSARAVLMHNRQPWPCCSIPTCRPPRSTRSRRKLPATFASTPSRTTSSRRCEPCCCPLHARSAVCSVANSEGSAARQLPRHIKVRTSTYKYQTMSASTMTPGEIVSELDKHIVGQNKAKKSVAVALRNRWRRQQVAEPLRSEIVPKNILMIGPTGVGKTEIARRLAKLANAPFIKIEATKFTEVGYVGRDVETIIRDLVEISVKQTREIEKRRVRTQAEDAAEDRILDALIPPPRNARGEPEREETGTRQTFRKRLREGLLDETEIEIDVAQPMPQME